MKWQEYYCFYYDGLAVVSQTGKTAGSLSTTPEAV